jgi:hypothetical protein
MTPGRQVRRDDTEYDDGDNQRRSPAQPAGQSAAGQDLVVRFARGTPR